MVCTALSLGLLLSGCDSDYGLNDNIQSGVGLSLSTAGVTQLDGNVAIKVEANSEAASSANVTLLGVTDSSGDPVDAGKSDLGSVSIGSDFTASVGDLGLSGVGYTATLQFSTDGPSGATKMMSVSMENALSTAAPSGVVQSPEKHYYHVMAEPVSATVSAMQIETKVGANGNYADQGAFNAQDSLEIQGNNYSVGDTLYVKTTASSQYGSVSTEDQIVIGIFTFANQSSNTLSETNTYIDLETNSVDVSENDSTDISFSYNSALRQVSLSGVNTTAGTTTNFVDTNGDAELYASGNNVEARNQFNSGVATPTLNDVSVGDVFIFQTSESTYGMVHITGINRTASAAEGDASVSFEYKYMVPEF